MEPMPRLCQKLGMRMDIFRNWLKDKINLTNTKQVEIAKYMGIAESELSKFLRGERKQLSVDHVALAAEYLNINLPEEIYRPSRFYVKKAPLRGTMAVGLWRATEMINYSSIGNIPYLPTRKFLNEFQYAYQVVDDHADLYFPPFSYVIFVHYHPMREQPLHGDIVHIEHSMLVSGRTTTQRLIEDSIRRVEIKGTTVSLKPISSKPGNKGDLLYTKGEDIRIVGLAIGYFVLIAEDPS